MLVHSSKTNSRLGTKQRTIRDGEYFVPAKSDHFPKSLTVKDLHLTFPRKSGHMIKFHEGAFHTALDSYTLMPNDSSGDYNTLLRIQRYSASPPTLYGTAPHEPTPS